MVVFNLACVVAVIYAGLFIQYSFLADFKMKNSAGAPAIAEDIRPSGITATVEKVTTPEGAPTSSLSAISASTAPISVAASTLTPEATASETVPVKVEQKNKNRFEIF